MRYNICYNMCKKNSEHIVLFMLRMSCLSDSIIFKIIKVNGFDMICAYLKRILPGNRTEPGNDICLAWGKPPIRPSRCRFVKTNRPGTAESAFLCEDNLAGLLFLFVKLFLIQRIQFFAGEWFCIYGQLHKRRFFRFELHPFAVFFFKERPVE